MAPNNIGPYVVKVLYTTPAATHTMSLNLDLVAEPDPGDLFSTIDTVTPNGTGPALDVVVDALITVLKPYYNSADATFDRADLYKWTGSGFDLTYLSSYTLGVAGTSASPTLETAQYVMTFRTTNGGIFRIDMMACVVVQGATIRPADFTAATTAIANHIISGDTPWIGRDNGYPFVPLGAYPGQNEKAFKTAYRP